MILITKMKQNKYRNTTAPTRVAEPKGEKSSRSLCLLWSFPWPGEVQTLAWGVTGMSLANCFPSSVLHQVPLSGSKNRIVRAVPIVLTNKVYHSISDDFKTVWVAALWNACEILWWRYAENFWKWNFLVKNQALGNMSMWVFFQIH